MRRGADAPVWMGLLILALTGLAVGAFLCVALLAVATAGTVDVRWNQASDCAAITGWEVMVAPVTAANPNPSFTSATVGVSIPTTGLTCGLNMQKTNLALNAVGQTRFWLRAVAGTQRSSESNSVDVSVPLGPPSGLTVSAP